jgi:hypothetical protein
MDTLDTIIYNMIHEIVRYDNSRSSVLPVFYIHVSVAKDLLSLLQELKQLRQEYRDKRL